MTSLRFKMNSLKFRPTNGLKDIKLVLVYPSKIQLTVLKLKDIVILGLLSLKCLDFRPNLGANFSSFICLIHLFILFGRNGLPPIFLKGDFDYTSLLLVKYRLSWKPNVVCTFIRLCWVLMRMCVLFSPLFSVRQSRRASCTVLTFYFPLHVFQTHIGWVEAPVEAVCVFTNTVYSCGFSSNSLEIKHLISI